MTVPLSVGDPAPDFTLPSTTGVDLTLSQTLASRNVLLAFYPLDFTAPCATMLSRLAGIADKLLEANTAIVGISVDSVYAHSVFAEKLKLPFPLASDFNRTICPSYGVLVNQLLGLKRVSRPVLFLVDRSGRVRYRWVGEEPSSVPDVQALVQLAKQL
jgi:peroxiredoxin